jgi:hypothetical protein
MGGDLGFGCDVRALVENDRCGRGGGAKGIVIVDIEDGGFLTFFLSFI